MRHTFRNLLIVTMVALLMPLKVAFAEPNGLPQLTGQWWQWALSIPPGVNPLNDDSGANCMIGQSGSTWFLAGTFGGAPVTRTCAVPADTELFFPVVNSVWFNSPNICGQGAEDFTVKEMRGWVAAFFDQAITMSVSLDGREVKPLQHVVSQPFAVALPEDNVFDAACAPFGGHPTGVFSPAVDEGYYVRLKPLSEGDHTLHIEAESAGGFAVDVTYNLTVVPVLKK